MFDISVLYKKIKKIKQQADKFQTNCYFDNYKLRNIAEKENSSLLIGLNYIFLIYDEMNFARLYYWISDIKDIIYIDNYLKNNVYPKDILLELLGTEESIREKKQHFLNVGFNSYSILSRYRAKFLKIKPVNNTDITYHVLEKEAVEYVPELLLSNLDPYESHLPTLDYLYELQKQKLLYGAYDNNKLIGILCLEKIGENGIYIYQISIMKYYQGKGIGTDIENFAFTKYPESNNFTTWINDNNLISQKMNIGLGYKKDGLKTEVLIYRKNV